MNGYYLHSRKIFELYIGKPQMFLVCEVILFNARYNTAVVNGIRVNPGQCLMKYEEIAEISGVSLSAVRTALKRFVADGGISTENKGKNGILITLLPPFSCEGERVKAREKKGSKPVFQKGNNKKPPVPDPDASYDIARADARARATVPVLKKRDRWETNP